ATAEGAAGAAPANATASVPHSANNALIPYSSSSPAEGARLFQDTGEHGEVPPKPSDRPATIGPDRHSGWSGNRPGIQRAASVAGKRVSRPVELHHRPLVEPGREPLGSSGSHQMNVPVRPRRQCT